MQGRNQRTFTIGCKTMSETKPTRTRYAVVLGSGLKADGSASPVTEIRAKAAAKFIRRHPMTLITSGSLPPYDKSTHGKTEASVMAEIVRAAGIETDILLEDQSFDTYGNGVFTVWNFLRHVEPGTLFVITSPFHLDRSQFIFSKLLGPKWRVRGSKSPEWEHETRHLKADEALARTRRFFDDIESGDLDACIAKLINEVPGYDRGQFAA